jgi:cytochrome b561
MNKKFSKEGALMATTVVTRPKRYHPTLVALHWTIAVLIFLNFLLAKVSENGTDIAGIPMIDFHMVFGILILGLLILRFVIRMVAQRPEWADSGNIYFNRIGEWIHWGLYLLTLAMTITGVMLAADTGYLSDLFGAASEQFRFGLGRFHETVWVLLLTLIGLHVAAALYHQFYIKDNLLKRMWFGEK